MKIVTARKPHICYRCAKDIIVGADCGQQYIRTVWVGHKRRELPEFQFYCVPCVIKKDTNAAYHQEADRALWAAVKALPPDSK